MTTPGRAAVVAALATIEGITPSPSMPDTPDAGTAWPVWVESRYRAGKLSRPFVPTYEVLVIAPAAYHPDTVEAGEVFAEDVAAALSTVGTVDVCEPRTIVFEQNATAMPGVMARVTVPTC